MIGLSSYDNGTKETWRGWQWNRIVERLPGYRRGMGKSARWSLAANIRVAYLCGPDDFDRQYAIERHGFRNENLFAIDINRENIDRVRASGGIGVACHLADAVAYWPGSLNIGVLVADLCSGFNKSTVDLIRALCWSRGVMPKAVVSVNMLRGRDGQSNDIHSSARKRFGESMRHRGKLFHKFGCVVMGASVSHNRRVANVGAGMKIGDIKLESENEIIEQIIGLSAPAFSSYRSGSQWFDSVVMSWPGTFANHLGNKNGGRLSFGENQDNWIRDRDGRNEAGKRVSIDRQSIIAKLAALVGQRNKMLGK